MLGGKSNKTQSNLLLITKSVQSIRATNEWQDDYATYCDGIYGHVVLQLTILALIECSPNTHLAIIWIHIYSSQQGAGMISNTSKPNSYFSLHTDKSAFWFLYVSSKLVDWVGSSRDSGNKISKKIRFSVRLSGSSREVNGLS